MKKYVFLVIPILLILLLSKTFAVNDFGLDFVRLNFEASNTKTKKPLISSIKNYDGNEKIYLELSKRTLNTNLKDLSQSVTYYLKAFFHYLKTTSGKKNLFNIFTLSLVFALGLSVLTITLSRLFKDVPLFVHEISESPKKLIYFLVLIPALFDFRLMLITLLFLISIHTNRKERLLVSALIIVSILGSYLYDLNKSFITTSTRGTPKAIDLVNSNKSNIPAIVNIKKGKEFEESFSHALGYLKEKRFDQALKLFRNLSAKFRDPRIDVNIGFLLVQKGNMSAAEESFKSAVAKEPLASAFYNLSILASDRLDFKKADEYFLKAVNLDFTSVTRFRYLHKGKTLHLMHEQLGQSEVFKYLLKKAIGSTRPSRFTLYGGIYGILLAVFVIVFLRKYRHRAIRCPKCGKIYCLNCERKIYWNGLCAECYSALVSFEAEPSERVKIILKTYEFTRKQRTIKSILSFTIPGLVLVRSNKLLRGFIYSFLFFITLFLCITSLFFEPDNLNGIHALIYYPSLLALVLVYAYSTIYTLKRVRKGWL